jgi:hypothetical protein
MDIQNVRTSLDLLENGGGLTVEGKMRTFKTKKRAVRIISLKLLFILPRAHQRVR